MSKLIRFLIFCAVLTATFSFKDVAMLVLLMSFGLTIPLMLAPTGLVYGLALIPVVYLWWEDASYRRLGIAISAVAVALIAVVPATMGSLQAEQSSRVLMAQDHKPTRPAGAMTLEIRRPAEDYEKVFESGDACGHECRGLLLSGQVAWIRVVMETQTSKRHDAPAITVYRVLHGKDCSVPGGIELQDASCVVMAEDTGHDADLIIQFSRREIIKERKPAKDEKKRKRGEKPPAEKIRLNMPFVWEGLRSVVAHLRSDGKLAEIYHQTDVRVGLPMTPTVIVPYMLGMSSHGLDFIRFTRHLNPITFARVIGDLGYTLPSAPEDGAPQKPVKTWRDGIDDDMTRGLIAVLDLPGMQTFNSEQSKVIFDWVMHARQTKVWTPNLIGLLKRIATDSRITRPTDFDQIFERNRDVTVALLPVILDEIERRGLNDDYTVPRQCAYTFSRIDPSLLTPYADRILKLLEKPGRVKEILLPVAGRLGEDPATILTPLGADLNQESRGQNGRAIAACLADKSRAATLIPMLREEIKASPPAGRLKWEIKAHRQWLLRALANLGDMAFVREQLTAPAADEREAKENERVLKLIDKAVSSPRRPDEVCHGSTY